jgi:hypothetical protein
MKELLQNLVHPYSRYGLAIALFEAQIPLDELTRENVSEVLAKAIDTGLENFRLMTDDNPQTAEVLRFRQIKKDDLLKDSKLVQSAGLANQGKYIAPSVVTTDGDAKGTFDNAKEIIESLRKKVSLTKPQELSRSFAPTTAKINNGKSSQTPPKGTLFECACNVITTLTPTKPASLINLSKKEGKVEFRNVVIIPDLPINELMDFLDLFQRMLNDSLKENIMEAVIKPEKAERKYIRPRIFNGNYPFAPRESAFGAVGLLAAIGKWGQRANQIERTKKVLESIAGYEEKVGRPVYVISYDGIAQVQFTHHVVRLAISGKLSDMISAFAYQTRLYTDTDGTNPNRYDDEFKTNYKLLSLMTGRFLQLFNQSAFQDFLAIRAEYSPIVEPLFKEYFMETRMIDREIVESARALGQWLNRAAFRVADSDIDDKYSEAERAKKIRQAKAKILVEFESAAMSATTPQDMMYRISTRAGRLLQMDMPAEATKFLDETLIGEKLKPKDALHLLVAYMRLRQNFEKSDKSANETKTQTETAVASESSDNQINIKDFS